jgi:hypothetical protein
MYIDSLAQNEIESAYAMLLISFFKFESNFIDKSELIRLMEIKYGDILSKNTEGTQFSKYLKIFYDIHKDGCIYPNYMVYAIFLNMAKYRLEEIRDIIKLLLKI